MHAILQAAWLCFNPHNIIMIRLSETKHTERRGGGREILLLLVAFLPLMGAAEKRDNEKKKGKGVQRGSRDGWWVGVLLVA